MFITDSPLRKKNDPYEKMKYCIDCRARPYYRGYSYYRTEDNHVITIKPIMDIIEDFNGMFNRWKAPSIQSSVASILTHLLNDTTRDRFPSSLYESFQQCLDDKTEINLDMSDLRWNVDPSFVDSLFGGRGYKMCRYSGTEEVIHPDFKDRYDVVDQKEYHIPEDGEDTNILGLDLLKKFKNLESLSVERVETRQGDYWPFSLFSFLSLLASTKIKDVEIKTDFSYSSEERTKSWLSTTWEEHQSSLVEAYAEKGYFISHKWYKTTSDSIVIELKYSERIKV